MKKRKLAVVLASVMLLSTGVTAFASNVEARNPTCPNCNEGMHRNYKLFEAKPCKVCGEKSGCYEHWWIWQCGVCGEYSKISLKESLCSNKN